MNLLMAVFYVMLICWSCDCSMDWLDLVWNRTVETDIMGRKQAVILWQNEWVNEWHVNKCFRNWNQIFSMLGEILFLRNTVCVFRKMYDSFESLLHNFTIQFLHDVFFYFFFLLDAQEVHLILLMKTYQRILSLKGLMTNLSLPKHGSLHISIQKIESNFRLASFFVVYENQYPWCQHL